MGHGPSTQGTTGFLIESSHGKYSSRRGQNATFGALYPPLFYRHSVFYQIGIFLPGSVVKGFIAAVEYDIFIPIPFILTQDPF
jgi:hypothetical protein